MGEDGGGEDTEAKRLAVKLYKELVEEILPRLREERDETRRYLHLLAWLNTRLESIGAGRIIITGGFAVEVYTGRTYRTMDVDIIVEGVEAERIIEELLSILGSRIGRGYLPSIDILAVKSIDIVSDIYNKPAKPVKLLIDNKHVYIEPPEELILTYLAGWKHWNSTEDRDKALWLYTTWIDKLDKTYLAHRAKQLLVEDKLKELERIAKQATRQQTAKERQQPPPGAKPPRNTISGPAKGIESEAVSPGSHPSTKKPTRRTKETSSQERKTTRNTSSRTTSPATRPQDKNQNLP